MPYNRRTHWRRNRRHFHTTYHWALVDGNKGVLRSGKGDMAWNATRFDDDAIAWFKKAAESAVRKATHMEAAGTIQIHIASHIELEN